jgi:hypothetical protein
MKMLEWRSPLPRKMLREMSCHHRDPLPQQFVRERVRERGGSGNSLSIRKTLKTPFEEFGIIFISPPTD